LLLGVIRFILHLSNIIKFCSISDNRAGNITPKLKCTIFITRNLPVLVNIYGMFLKILCKVIFHVVQFGPELSVPDKCEQVL
jgi:hypothetical protein